ncbi:branched-chain amino acid aminotransferase [Nonlabens sp. Hel1_33_55]|uniref:aminotransferase class IV n=1 Tax=Nonlabens sp. Hel1_33_55 TaxID=1336802 RepID=UPI000875E8DB|nr:aminotransferase class IV [Nonlabens sp. Hel1_33_55]SCY01065.1 branched-chain amino acid aminotransferase [Nonlabens sp. Hel1_33_55]
MVILNDRLVEKGKAQIAFNNRGTYYGDGVFETIRCYKGIAIFNESHYFRLMSSMRILRMEIPNTFTPEFFEQQILALHESSDKGSKHSRVRITVWRNEGGLYTPEDQTISYSMELRSLSGPFQKNAVNEVELFKDHLLPLGMLGTIKTTSKTINVLAGIYKTENDYDDMLLLNQNKMVAECISGNLFLRSDNIIKTPPITDGCLNGIMRGQVIAQLKRMFNYSFVEESITPFELQRADELFSTNVVQGIKSISKYRKKEYDTAAADELRTFFNEKLFD